MLSTFYSPQALPSAYGGFAPGYDLGHGGPGQHQFGGQHPFAGSLNPFLGGYPSFGQHQFPYGQLGQSPFGAMNPYLMNPYLQSQGHHYPQQSSPFSQGQFSPFPQGQFSSFGGQQGVTQIVPALAQLAQQISAQSILTQQIGSALHQLVQQLVAQSLQSQAGAGLGGGVQSPFATPSQGAYGGFNQTQGWNANRPQTIQ